MKRIKLSKRLLPNYTHAEEIMNMVTHITGGGLGIFALIGCLIKAIRLGSGLAVFGAVVYGLSLIVLYTISSVYHGLKPSMGKKVMQILDHCAIYLRLWLCAINESGLLVQTAFLFIGQYPGKDRKSVG